MRAFVTGGAGFVGSTLVDRLLAEGHAVDVVDNLSRGSLANLADARRNPDHELRFQRLDVTSDGLAEVLGRHRPDVVYHLAAGPGGPAALDDPVADATTTVIGSLMVLEAARRAQVRKVVFAVPATMLYADEPTALPARESSPVRPLDPHAVAKDAVHRYLAVYRERHDLEFTTLAVADVYGPRQAPSADPHSVVDLVRHHLAGDPVTLAAPPSASRDHVYVDDVVDALARAAERGSGLLVNVGTGTETTLADLIATVAAATGQDVPVSHEPAAVGTPLRRRLDPGRAAIHLGWKPWTGLDAGVAAVVDWVRTSASG